jgi:hypothetical protein
MTNQVTLTKELNAKMHPTKRVYNSTSLPTVFTHDEISWSSNDDQYVIKLDRNTNIITGHYYDWDEEAQDWTDKHDVPMTADQIMRHITNDHLLMVR